MRHAQCNGAVSRIPESYRVRPKWTESFYQLHAHGGIYGPRLHCVLANRPTSSPSGVIVGAYTDMTLTHCSKQLDSPARSWTKEDV